MIWCRASFLNVESPEYLQWLEDMRKYHVGSFAMSVHVDGPFLLRTEPYEAAEILNRLQKESKLPLLFAADFERGVSTRLMGTTSFPHAMAFGADGSLEDAEMFGRITAQEARAVGVHWNFFPDADVNSNPANPIINTRSFGEDPKQVGDLVTAYIKGAREGGMLTTVKHFPGHGDTATDSHLGVASVNVDRAHLDSIELPPFRQAIAAGVDAVMVAHVTVPALDPDPNHVATISTAVTQRGFPAAVVAVVVVAGSFDLTTIVNEQRNYWFWAPLFLALIVFLTGMLAEMERIPFDLPEAEAELVEGWNTEYGGMLFAFFMVTDYFRALVGSILVVLLFLGGWTLPSYVPSALTSFPLAGIVWFMVKTYLVFGVFVWIRASLPRVRTDQLLRVGWMRMIPLSLASVVLAAMLVTVKCLPIFGCIPSVGG